MFATDTHFKWIAESVSKHLAEMLGAYVHIYDEANQHIAYYRPETVVLPFDVSDGRARASDLRIPLSFNGRAAEIVISGPVDDGVISPRAAQMLVDLLLNQLLATAYLQDRYELKNKLIYNLLHRIVSDEADIIREAEILGMDFTRPRAVLLIEADCLAHSDAADPSGPAPAQFTDQVRIQQGIQLIISIVVRFFQLPSDAICAYIGDGQVAVLKASAARDLAEWVDSRDVRGQSSASWANLSALKKACEGLLSQLQHETGASVSIGIGRYHPGILGLAASYEDARAALALGRSFQGHNLVHCLDSLGNAAFVGVSDRSTKLDLARHLLSPLDQEPELVETLSVFFEENCNQSSTAGRLSIHRNTLLYRLNKIQMLTGLDPRVFREAIQLQLALVLRAMG